MTSFWTTDRFHGRAICTSTRPETCEGQCNEGQRLTLRIVWDYLRRRR